MAQKTLIGTPLIEVGRYRVRMAGGDDDLVRALTLRARLFRGAPDAADADGFDPLCRHVLVEEIGTGALVCTYRLRAFADGRRIGESYAAQFYELSALSAFDGPLVEIGRFCIAPEARDADVLRLAWGALARLVDAEGIEMLFGCTSFPGTDAADHREAFAYLNRHHLAPARWRPRLKAREVVRFGENPGRVPDANVAQKTIPPVLRSYLAMGGWVSDHAVRDRDLGTLHVFTGLEVGRVPAHRKRALHGMVRA